ncbi:MAG: hypothetical protein LV480_12640, partial [Methylacidiphilales bacterium]|nr:hypothetical protein [Candidatus Methylacidiphilales bacterium]
MLKKAFIKKCCHPCRGTSNYFVPEGAFRGNSERSFDKDDGLFQQTPMAFQVIVPTLRYPFWAILKETSA